MPGVRTFIALDPGEAIRARMVSLQESLRRTGTEVKWVGPENLHLTLLFLGEVDSRELMGVCRAVEDATRGRRAIEISVEGAGCFPNMRRPHVVWIGVGQGAEEIAALHDALEKPLLELGCYRREERRFTPHITLGRIRSEKPMDALTQALLQKQDYKAGDATVAEVLIMSSELSPHGPTYTVMSRVPLGSE
jgi:2'-5' RNA ligase